MVPPQPCAWYSARGAALGVTALHVARGPLREVALSVPPGGRAGLRGPAAANHVIASDLFGVSRMDPGAVLPMVGVLGSVVLQA